MPSEMFRPVTGRDFGRSIAWANATENEVLAKIHMPPRFTPAPRYVNRSGALNDPDQPDDCDEQQASSEQAQHDAGERDAEERGSS